MRYSNIGIKRLSLTIYSCRFLEAFTFSRNPHIQPITYYLFIYLMK